MFCPLESERTVVNYFLQEAVAVLCIPEDEPSEKFSFEALQSPDDFSLNADTVTL